MGGGGRPDFEHFYGLVDIGSNGVRFSITNLHERSARIMPTVFQDRAPISLYDAQFSGTTKAPISSTVISQLVTCMLRFKITCDEFRVPKENVRVVATEATREAQNSDQFREAIKNATGWEVELLSKEDEGRIGAEGVASSFSEVQGLVMDLGGGSTQITWLISKDGATKSPHTALSFPYGAAAVTKKLETALDNKARRQLHEKMVQDFSDAFKKLHVPRELLEDAEDGELTLYLSGGGFRGFGYLLMERSEYQPYPIPIINGFMAPAHEFRKVAIIHKDHELSAELREELENSFGISARRAKQVRAVAFVVEALMEAIPQIRRVIFCQGGVREGAMYETLPQKIRAEHPLHVATRQYAPADQPKLLELLNHSLPRSAPYHLRAEILPALANLLILHSNVPKQSQASVALYATTTGVLSSAHGLTHQTRALLALALCERWGGGVHAVAQVLRQKFQLIVGYEDVFWAKYIGLVAHLIGIVYPAGKVREGQRISFFAQDDGKRREKERRGDGGSSEEFDDGSSEPRIWLKVNVRKGDATTSTVMFEKAVWGIEKVGKKKKSGLEWRRKVVVNVIEDM